MKVLVVGKTDSVAHWTENVADAFEDYGARVEIFSVNKEFNRLLLKIYKAVSTDRFNQLLGHTFNLTVDQYKPDIIFFTHAFWSIPETLYVALNDVKLKPITVGWVGDKFTKNESFRAASLDLLYFTDSSFIRDAEQFGFKDNFSYLPLAVNPRLFYPVTKSKKRRLLFIANCTENRAAIVSKIKTPIVIHGKGWERMSTPTPHTINNKLIPFQKIPDQYNSYFSVLNIVNEDNLNDGINQRTFEPLACKTAVITDRVNDLDNCLEPDKEIFVYDGIDDLNRLYDQIINNNDLVASVAEHGYRRVISEHTFRHRIEKVINDTGLT